MSTPAPTSSGAATARSDVFDSIAASVVGPPFEAAPGAVVAASMRGRRAEGAAGRRVPGADAVTIDTVYDLASVSKSFVAVAFARLERASILSRRELLGDVLALARGTASERVSLDLLLAHRAGLEAHLPLFAGAERRFADTAEIARPRSVALAEAVRIAGDARRADCDGAPPIEGFPPVYSDLGYLLAGAAMEARVGLDLDEIVRREVMAPLGIEARVGSARQLFGDAARRARVAPTEVVSFRGGLVDAVVHDENAFVVAGDGLAGHAGLFGDAAAVRAFGEALLAVTEGRRDWLSENDLAPLVRVRPGGSLRAGFDGRAGDAPSSGARLSADTFGHLGFTGTSLWIDPRAGFVGVLLTNRVHPTREHIAIRKARPSVYDAMFDALAGTTGVSSPASP